MPDILLGMLRTMNPKVLRHKRSFITILMSSLLSLWASLVLAIDAIKLAADKDSDLSCNINAIISCGKVGISWQSNLLGFPNAYLGLMFEPMIITIAVAALGGVVFPNWFMRTALGVYSIGLMFALWLFFQSYFIIGAFCPWCLLVTFSTISVFSHMVRVNIINDALLLPSKLTQRLSVWLALGRDYAVLAVLYGALITAIMLKYGQSIF